MITEKRMCYFTSALRYSIHAGLNRSPNLWMRHQVTLFHSEISGGISICSTQLNSPWSPLQ